VTPSPQPNGSGRGRAIERPIEPEARVETGAIAVATGPVSGRLNHDDGEGPLARSGRLEDPLDALRQIVVIRLPTTEFPASVPGCVVSSMMRPPDLL
jgi:hypothetical protein